MERSLTPRYAYSTVPVGAAGDIAPPTKTGAIEWDMQSISFIISLCFQLATLIVSAITLANSGDPNPAPPLLIIVVVMELIVQCVEIVWYGVVGALYYFGLFSIGVRYRYWDWVITTPVGLTALIIFVWYLECQSATTDILNDGSRIAAIVVIILADWEMLFVGYVYEAEVTSVTKVFDRWIGYIGLRSEGAGLYFGWVPFVVIFIPMLVALGTAHQSNLLGWGWFTVIITFVTWGLYGVVALYWRKPTDAKMKNTAYNLLDIVSKNIVGLVTSIVALNLSTGTQNAPWQNVTCVANVTA